MKPIMKLYSGKVTITATREVCPLAKSDEVIVAGNPQSGIIYTNATPETLAKFIVEGIKSDPRIVLLKMAIDLSDEIKIVPDLKISEEGKIVVEETFPARVLMHNKFRNVIICGDGNKVYTNDAEAANKCLERDIEAGESAARLLKMLIDHTGGLIECELK